MSLFPKIRQWLSGREMTLTADGGFATVGLVKTIQRPDSQALPAPMKQAPVRMVVRGKITSRLFDLPAEQPSSKPGPKPKKGKRQQKLREKALDDSQAWQRAEVDWYGGVKKTVEFLSQIALWHTPGEDPAPVRYLLVRECQEESSDAKNSEAKKSNAKKSNAKKLEAAAFICTDTEATPLEILQWAILRWNIEVTFEEIRAHLGLETQRHWSQSAINRVTPCLFGLFSLVVCMTKILHPVSLPLRQSSWYKKEEGTFSDALAAVRAHLWQSFRYAETDPPTLESLLCTPAFAAGSETPAEYLRSPHAGVLCLIPQALLRAMHDAVCYAT